MNQYKLYSLEINVFFIKNIKFDKYNLSFYINKFINKKINFYINYYNETFIKSLYIAITYCYTIK